MRNYVTGLSLIEVLVASAVLATGILCLVSLQASALGIGQVSAHRQQASLLLMELTEISFISPQAFRGIEPASVLFADMPSESCFAGALCAPAPFIQHELQAWVDRVRRQLPDVEIDIQRDIQLDQLVWIVNLDWYGPQESGYSHMQSELYL